MEKIEIKNAYRNGVRDFSGRDLSGCDLSVLQSQGCDFTGSTLEGANFRNSDLSGCDFSGANLRDADLTSALLNKSDFINADMRGSNIAGAILHGVDLRGSRGMYQYGPNPSGGRMVYAVWHKSGWMIQSKGTFWGNLEEFRAQASSHWELALASLIEATPEP